MVMSPEFRHDTARLFLTMFGRSRNIRRELAGDALELFESDPSARRASERLITLLAAEPSKGSGQRKAQAAAR
jgi:hypothetical protein